MTPRAILISGVWALASVVLAAGVVVAGSVSVLWSQPNPGGLEASVGAVAWAPNGSLVATGLSDRWVRIRAAADGRQVGSILQPHRSHGVIRLLFSNDSQFLAVGNGAGTGQFRVYQVSSLTFLGTIVATVDSRSILHYSADAQLASAPGGAGQLSGWRVSELPVFVQTGTGYDKVTTRFQLSPNGAQETAVSKSTVTVRRVSDGAILATVPGESSAFSPDSATIAAWTSNPNQTRLYRTSDFVATRTINAVNGDDAIQLGWTPTGNLVGSGYLPVQMSEGWDQHGIIRIWRLSDGALLKRYDRGLSLGVTSNVAFTSDGAKLAVGVYDGTTVAATNQF